jgi:hypothetical protein
MRECDSHDEAAHYHISISKLVTSSLTQHSDGYRVKKSSSYMDMYILTSGLIHLTNSTSKCHDTNSN